MKTVDYFGLNAGKIWKVLKSEGPKTLGQLQKSTGMTLKEVSMGLGWLAREGKIAFKDTDRLYPKFELNE